jgi:hypothetical protein
MREYYRVIDVQWDWFVAKPEVTPFFPNLRFGGHSTEISRGHSAKDQICVLSLLSQGAQIPTRSGCAEESGGRRLSKGAVERSVSSHLRVLRRLDPQ